MNRFDKAVAVLVFLAVVLAVLYVRGEAATARVGACERGNVVRADRIIDTRDPDDSAAERARVPVIFPLLDCAATTAKRREIPLSVKETKRFVDLIERARRPIVEDGKVVGSGGFPHPAAVPLSSCAPTR